MTSYDVTSQYLAFKIAHFVELNRGYQPAKFRWPHHHNLSATLRVLHNNLNSES